MGEEKKYNLDYLNSISNNDENFVKEMVASFSSNTPVYLGEIEKFYRQKNFEFLYKAVHKFIPTLAFVGANEKNEKFEKLEKLAFTKKDSDEIEGLVEELTTYCNMVIEQLKTDFKI